MTSKIKYIGITIGPIIKTLEMAKSTKGMWTASYMFSYLMRLIVKDIKEEVDFLMPFAGAEILKPYKGAGLFPDRIIAIPKKDNSYQVVVKAIEDRIDGIAKAIANDLKKTEAEIYVKNHLRCIALEIELEEQENPMLLVPEYLDTLELQDRIQPPEEINYLSEFFERKETVSEYRNFLMRDIANSDEYRNLPEADFGRDQLRFESISEISTRELNEDLFQTNKNKYKEIFWSGSNDESEIFDKLKINIKGGKELKRAHRYIAIVQADGDHIGKLIKVMFESKNDPLIQNRFLPFSKALFDFAKEAVDEIQKYGGLSVYSGGDDLLFFAPVICNGDNIFDLISKLDEAFKKQILDNPKLATYLKTVLKTENVSPSLSFGVSISYYKFPLQEALAQSINLLLKKAKKPRNAIAFRLLKHSGAFFGTVLKKKSKAYTSDFQKMLSYVETDKTSTFLTSVQYKLVENEEFLRSSLERPNATKAFFDNNFNESAHHTEFIRNDLEPFIKNIHQVSDNFKETLVTAHSTLRMVHFLNQKDEDE